MAFIGTNVFLGDSFVGRMYLGEEEVKVSPFNVPPAYVTGGLVIYMDSTEPSSYIGSGTSWYNLIAGQPFTGSLQANVSYVNGYLQTTSSANGYIEIPGFDYTSTNYTVMAATRYTDTVSNGRMVAGLNNNWLVGNYNNSTENYFAGGDVYGMPAGANDTNWRIYAGTGNIAGDSYGFYVNASLLAQNANGSYGPNGLLIGRQNGGGETSDGQVCFVMVYNRVLSGTEITQNYNALKSKVGL